MIFTAGYFFGVFWIATRDFGWNRLERGGALMTYIKVRKKPMPDWVNSGGGLVREVCFLVLVFLNLHIIRLEVPITV